MLRNVAMAGLFLGLFGCEWGYPADAEDTTTRVVEGTCPDADLVAGRWHDGEGERTEWHPIPMPLLCYYRVDIAPDADPDELPLVAKECRDRPETLDDVREEAKRTNVPDPATARVRTFDYLRCTADGVVLVRPVTTDACPEPEAALDRSDAARGLEAGALLASDTRAPWRSCTYHVDFETTRRPFSCGGMGGPMQ